MYIHTYVMKDRPNFEDAPHGSAILNKISTKNQTIFEDAPHGSAILINNFRMLRTGAYESSDFLRMLGTGARFSSKFSECSARKRDFEPT